MVVLALAALILGVIYGLAGLDIALITVISSNTDILLYILMLSVGISIGLHKGLYEKIKQYHLKIFIIPFGIIIGSILGGVVCGLLLNYPINQSAAIASGLGWYSLSGATIGNLAGPKLGGIAFLSNLMREIFSFILIPIVALKFNYYTCIAPAGATSEDTTLPMMIKYTNEETVVLAVLNGIICSTFVPILISFFFNM